jgi:HAD superfamily hydrolase (TIGR01509 family)
MSPRFGAVIFDLDGVLVDSEIWWDEVRAAFAGRHDRAWTEDDRAAVMGANSRQWSEIMADRLRLTKAPSAVEREIVDSMMARYASELPPVIEGAADVVRRIGRSFPIAVASSAHREVIDAALDALGLTAELDAIVSSDEVAHGKPEPDVYLATAGRLGVARDACLVVEDSLNGVRAGRAAGMTVVLVPNPSVPPAPGAREAASVVLDRLEGVEALLT